MSAREPRRFAIPRYWTAAQANAVVELLVILLDEITFVYEGPLHELDRLARLQPPDCDPPDSEDDPIPF